jgi:Tetratricopeptide repeat
MTEYTRERLPLVWAVTQTNLGTALRALGARESDTQNNLGTALEKLGERESGTARLEEAIDAYRAALHTFEEADARLLCGSG